MYNTYNFLQRHSDVAVLFRRDVVRAGGHAVLAVPGQAGPATLAHYHYCQAD